jgi:tRNA A37 threonylcarbamoyladenosine dehydratase
MTERLSRQSFLGQSSDEILAHCRVGIIGLGGGGSHIAQQLSKGPVVRIRCVCPPPAVTLIAPRPIFKKKKEASHA